MTVRTHESTWTTDRIVAGHHEHLITSWSTQSAVTPLPITGGEGCWFFDDRGNRYLDFQSQLVNLSLGHQHPRVVEAIREQAARLCYIGPSMAEQTRSELAELISEVTPGDLTATFFTTGGAAANENAIKLARHYTGRHKVITRYRSYHGASAGAMSLSGDPRRWAAEPGIPGVVRALDPYTYRCPAGHPDPCPVCSGAPHLEEILAYEDPGSVAAIVLETVTGTNGVLVPPDGYLTSVRELCDRYGILLILDEVMVGFGRTGRWFACDHWGVVPDILCTAKGINSGYVPLGAMTVSQRIRDWLWTNPFPGGLTYSSHPLACASGVASIKAMRDEEIVGNADRQGAHLGRALAGLAARHPSVGDVRGLGLFWGIELVTDRATRAPLVPFNAKGAANRPMAEVISAAMSRGLYLSSASSVIRIAPPLIITEAEIDHGVAILDEVLDIADRHYTGGE
jgi:taurine--2-oxoglutarate transaminase